MNSIAFSVHDEHPAEQSEIVDRGLGRWNDAAAPLHEVKPLACFARSAAGAVIGGAVGRRWGNCCELQQLWVQPDYRRQGVATKLVRAFEAHAQAHGCLIFYLETFSFQCPALYESLGYTAAYVHDVYPHGIVKYVMVKRSHLSTRAS
jgi:GNAT superfamily N-acetyltransferase